MELERKFGFWTGLALVIGIVIGSGIFFKADDILVETGGNVKLALLAFVVGALAMIFGALTFSEISKDTPDNNGLNDYIKNSFGKFGDMISQFVGWFMAVLYFPVLMASLPIVASSFTHILFGVDPTYFSLVSLGLLYLFCIFTLNMLAPILASKFQISTTIIKLIPLAGVAIFGIIFGIINGTTVDALTDSGGYTTGKGSFIGAVIIVAYTYDGWILATNINKELKNPDKNLPKILIIGPLFILFIYVTYFLGVVSSESIGSFISPIEGMTGDDASIMAIENLFGKAAGSVLTVFIVISVLGALNGIVMAGTKSFYHMGSEGKGILPDKTSKILDKSNFPIYSGIFSLICAVPLLFIWAFSFLFDTFNYSFDESTIGAIQIVYISLYISFIIRSNDRHFVKRFIIPILAITGSMIILYSASMRDTIYIDISVVSIVLVVYIPIYLRNKTNSTPSNAKH